MSLPRRAAVIILSLIAAIIALFALYTWAALHWSYSEGDRAGYLQKFSKKGWLCKTWEGEILLSSMPGAIPEHFAFTVRDDAVAKQMLAAMGHRVQISYQQHKGLPSTCFGETEYFVTGVTVGPQPPAPPSAM
ncbi:hypothetical protein [Massilia horti]|uniref:6-phosphogluconate dehydrogenase n=1 Tax=Massilia horti TaxID=2562153 RepID=A0A4Y9T161_9BURK|nr:hypothetical protein [Massilia horti]TFW33185.1 hypothetical protein E4O92_07395 [Massilia horti]